jgi:hypothetical protein
MPETLVTITELARQLNVRSFQLAYAHQQGHLPEPGRIAGRRVYGAAEVEQARRYAELHGLAGRRRGRPGGSLPTPEEGRST